jgi:hypothetical protein
MHLDIQKKSLHIQRLEIDLLHEIQNRAPERELPTTNQLVIFDDNYAATFRIKSRENFAVNQVPTLNKVPINSVLTATSVTWLA